MEGTVTAMPATPLYDRLGRVIDRIDDVLMVIGCLMLFVLMFVVVADVALRYLLSLIHI